MRLKNGWLEKYCIIKKSDTTKEGPKYNSGQVRAKDDQTGVILTIVFYFKYILLYKVYNQFITNY